MRNSAGKTGRQGTTCSRRRALPPPSSPTPFFPPPERGDQELWPGVLAQRVVKASCRSAMPLPEEGGRLRVPRLRGGGHRPKRGQSVVRTRRSKRKSGGCAACVGPGPTTKQINSMPKGLRRTCAGPFLQPSAPAALPCGPVLAAAGGGGEEALLAADDKPFCGVCAPHHLVIRVPPLRRRRRRAPPACKECGACAAEAGALLRG